MYTSLLRIIVSPVPIALFAALAIGAWAGSSHPQKSTSKSATSTRKKSVAKTRSAKAPVKSAAKGSTSAKSQAKKPVVVVHHAQQPSPERYKEIQQALVAKGYFQGEPDGNWGPASVDALKHFQHDQNLMEDGKIASLSLIALGLGPKRDATESPQKTSEPEQKIP